MSAWMAWARLSRFTMLFGVADLIAKSLMTQEAFDQEWLLSPHAAIKGAYYSRALAAAYHDKRIRSVPYDAALPVFDVWDLGKGPHMVVGMFQRFGREVRMIDYYEGQDSDGIPQVVANLQRKPYVWGKHFAPHDIRATDPSTGKTRYEAAERLGWKFDIVPDIGIDGGQWQISTSGGTHPLWAPDGRELFYRRDDALMTVPVQTEPSFTPGTPEVLFEGTYTPGAGGRTYDVSQDGQRFLMIKNATVETAQQQMILVQNWFKELRRLVPRTDRLFPAP